MISISKWHGVVSFECPVAGCGYMVSGNFGQEADDALDHLDEEALSAQAEGRDDDLRALIADAAKLGAVPELQGSGSDG